MEAKSRAKDGRYRIAKFPTFKLERKLNALDLQGWELKEILERDSSTVKCLLQRQRRGGER